MKWSPTHAEKGTGYPIALVSQDDQLTIYHDGFTANARMATANFRRQYIPIADWGKAPPRAKRTGTKRKPASKALQNRIKAELGQEAKRPRRDATDFFI